MAEERDERAGGGQPDARAALKRFQLHGIQETGKELGRGSYAAVIEVEFKGMRCAAKKIHNVLSVRGEENRVVERFQKECPLLGTLRHPHIVQFLGIYFDPATDLPVLVMEFLPVTLTQCLKRCGRLPAEVSYAILRDVALGLQYLHEHDPLVIHRDLSANNVLLTGDMTAKISDLGVAKIFYTKTDPMTSAPGTQSYMPPEALSANPCYNKEVDVFSFGVMMVHVLSGQWPIPSKATQADPHNSNRVVGFSEVERRAQYLNIIGRPSEEQEGHPLMPLIERCLNYTPNLRPTSSELVERMNEAVTKKPLTFNIRVDIMQKMQIEREKEGQVKQGEVAQREQQEISQQQERALAVEAKVEATDQQQQAEVEVTDQQHQAKVEAMDQQHKAKVKGRDGQLWKILFFVSLLLFGVYILTSQSPFSNKATQVDPHNTTGVSEYSIKLSSQSSLPTQQRSTRTPVQKTSTLVDKPVQGTTMVYTSVQASTPVDTPVPETSAPVDTPDPLPGTRAPADTPVPGTRAPADTPVPGTRAQVETLPPELFPGLMVLCCLTCCWLCCCGEGHSTPNRTAPPPSHRSGQSLYYRQVRVQRRRVTYSVRK